MIIVLLIHLRNLREYPKDNRHHSEEESKVLPQIVHALSEHGVDPSGVHMFSHGGGTAHRFRPVRQVSHFTPGQLRQLLSQQSLCGGVAAKFELSRSQNTNLTEMGSGNNTIHARGHMTLILLFAPEVVV